MLITTNIMMIQCVNTIQKIPQRLTEDEIKKTIMDVANIFFSEFFLDITPTKDQPDKISPQKIIKEKDTQEWGPEFMQLLTVPTLQKAEILKRIKQYVKYNKTNANNQDTLYNLLWLIQIFFILLTPQKMENNQPIKFAEYPEKYIENLTELLSLFKLYMLPEIKALKMQIYIQQQLCDFYEQCKLTMMLDAIENEASKIIEEKKELLKLTLKGSDQLTKLLKSTQEKSDQLIEVLKHWKLLINKAKHEFNNANEDPLNEYSLFVNAMIFCEDIVYVLKDINARIPTSIRNKLDAIDCSFVFLLQAKWNLNDVIYNVFSDDGKLKRRIQRYTDKLITLLKQKIINTNHTSRSIIKNSEHLSPNDLFALLKKIDISKIAKNDTSIQDKFFRIFEILLEQDQNELLNFYEEKRNNFVNAYTDLSDTKTNNFLLKKYPEFDVTTKQNFLIQKKELLDADKDYNNLKQKLDAHISSEKNATSLLCYILKCALSKDLFYCDLFEDSGDMYSNECLEKLTTVDQQIISECWLKYLKEIQAEKENLYEFICLIKNISKNNQDQAIYLATETQQQINAFKIKIEDATKTLTELDASDVSSITTVEPGDPYQEAIYLQKSEEILTDKTWLNNKN